MEKNQIILEVDGVEIQCNQESLAQNSDYFKAMFHGSFIENKQKTIHLKDLNPSDMKLTLYLIDNVESIRDLNVNQALGVLQISSMFQFRDLQPAIESHLSKNLLTTESCLCIANAAEALLIPKLRDRALIFSFWEFPQVQHTEAFLESQLEELKSYLSSDMLHTPKGEIDVFNAAVRWLSYNNFTYTLEVLKCVRFHLLSLEDLTTNLDDLRTKNSKDCSLITEIITSILDSKVPNRDEVAQENQVGINAKTSRRQHHRVSVDMMSFTKQLNSSPRRSLLVPCFAGYVTQKNQESQKKPKMFAFCFDETRKDSLFPFMTIENDAVGCVIVSRGDIIYTVGGEQTLGQGKWNNKVRTFNVWQNKWDELTDLLSPRRHHSVILIDDDIYLLCGCGKFRVVLETFEKYNTKKGEWTKLQSLPQNAYSVAACAHKGSIYVVQNQALCYQYNLRTDQWTKVPANFPPAAGFNSALSYGDFIYLTGPYSNDLYKFKPGCGSEAILVGEFSHGANATCLVDCYIYSFTAADGEIYVERYDISTNEFSIIYSSKTDPLSFNVDFIPPVRAFPAVNCLEEICIEI